MKKIYLFTTLFISASVMAQPIIYDFESHPLSPEFYDNGSAGGGDFVFGEITLTNYYDTAWGSWDGFAISNVTDNVTAGWGNQYSAYPGSGANGSSNYAVYYFNGAVTGPMGFQFAIDSFKITNNTYAAISMRDGDAFAKKFGSPNDASGSPDGTNGEDYFRVWIRCMDQFGNAMDSIEYYLADYRFADSTQDYIVDQWENIDLTGLWFQVHGLTFRFESSDNGGFGMNTPAYFAVDDIATQWYLGLGNLSEEKIKIYPNPASNSVSIDARGHITVRTLSGGRIESHSSQGKIELDVSKYPIGVYLICVENEAGSFVERLIIR